MVFWHYWSRPASARPNLDIRYTIPFGLEWHGICSTHVRMNLRNGYEFHVRCLPRDLKLACNFNLAFTMQGVLSRILHHPVRLDGLINCCYSALGAPFLVLVKIRSRPSNMTNRVFDCARIINHRWSARAVSKRPCYLVTVFALLSNMHDIPADDTAHVQEDY